MTIKQHGILWQKQKGKFYHCNLCLANFESQQLLNYHLRKTHPKFRFVCKFCNQKYQTYNGHYKHEWLHVKGKYKCAQCSKTFQFPKGLDDHSKTHTQKKLMYTCWRWKCARVYASKIAREDHFKTQSNNIYVCLYCDFEMNTRNNITQHMKEKHSKGLKSYCGKYFRWPSTRNGHQHKC